MLVLRTVLFLEKTYAERLNLMQSEVHITTAANVLKKFAASRFQGFNLRHGGRMFGYRPRHFMMVADMIGRGDIEFMLKPAMQQKRGVYRSRGNSIAVVRSPNEGWYSTLIHEATHAIQDMYNLSGTKGDYEVGAHIAQAAYLMLVGGQPPANSRIAQDPIVAEAVSAVVLDRPGDVVDVIHKDIIKVIRNGGYGSKVDSPVKQNVFDPRNFLDLWLRI